MLDYVYFMPASDLTAAWLLKAIVQLWELRELYFQEVHDERKQHMQKKPEC